MKKIILGSLVLILFTSMNTFAAGKEITVSVKGMVCGFCAQGIQKKFSTQSSVDKVNVSLGEKRVTLTLKDGKDISDATITQLLTESGYNVEKVVRN